MQTSLDKIANKAKSNKKHRFQNLYGMLDESWLEESFGKLNKRSAYGVDKVGVREYGENLAENVSKLVDRLKRKVYKAKLVRRQYIPKSNGKLRPLGIPATEDKLLQVGAAQILQAIYEQDFLDFSYGYRPRVGARDAVAEIRTTFQTGRYGYVVEADIKGFFDNLSHDWLVRMLELRIDDRAFVNLIRKWLKAGVMDTDGKVISKATGTPQGGIVSPVLANLYLHYALDLWFQKRVAPQSEGMAAIVRYADDFICMFQYKRDAERFYAELPNRLAKFNLEVAPEKTKIIRFNRFRKAESEAFDFLGFEFRWNTSRKGRDVVFTKTSLKKLRTSLGNFAEWCRENRNDGLGKFVRRLNPKLLGYYNYFGVIGNYDRLVKFYRGALRTVFRSMNRRSQKRSFGWKKFTAAIKFFGIEKPRITMKRVLNVQYTIYDFLRFC